MSAADDALGAALRAADAAFIAGMQADDEAYATALHQSGLMYAAWQADTTFGTSLDGTPCRDSQEETWKAQR